MAEAYGIDELPDVQAERNISVLEAADVLAECMTETGFPMKVDEAGLVAGELEESQEGAHKLAMVTCWLRFPLDDKYVQPPTISNCGSTTSGLSMRRSPACGSWDSPLHRCLVSNPL